MTTQFTASIAEIEDEGFLSRLSVSSKLDTLVRGLTAQPEFAHLESALRSDSSTRGELLARLQNILRLEVDPRYENPLDLPVAIYLLALARVSPDLGRRAAVLTLQVGKNLWWGRSLAKRLGVPVRNDATEALQKLGRVRAMTRQTAEAEYQPRFEGPLTVLRNQGTTRSANLGASTHQLWGGSPGGKAAAFSTVDSAVA